MSEASTDLDRVVACIGNFPGEVVGQMLLASSDLCIVVGPDMVVQDVIVGFALQDAGGVAWQGHSLRVLVGLEGQRKIDLLWSGAGSKTGWRHLNFRMGAHGESLPLLVQRIAVEGGSSVLVCRDLRPSVRMQEQFNRAMTEMEQRREDINDLFSPETAPIDLGQGAAQGAVIDARAAQGDAQVRRALSDLGHQPLSDIVTQTARVLEEMCIREAYAQCDHDLNAAADILGMDVDELARSMTFFQAKG